MDPVWAPNPTPASSPISGRALGCRGPGGEERGAAGHADPDPPPTTASHDPSAGVQPSKKGLERNLVFPPRTLREHSKKTGKILLNKMAVLCFLSKNFPNFLVSKL